jgi:regulator of sigma E protease
MFVIGRQDYSATVGQVQGLAAQAGLQPGDRIMRAGDRVATWSDAAMALTNAALDRATCRSRVETPDGLEGRHVLALSHCRTGSTSAKSRRSRSDMEILAAPTLVGEVATGGPADGVLHKGDRLLAIDGKQVDSAAQVSALVQALGKQPGGMIEVERDGERLALQAAPQHGRPQGHGSWASPLPVRRRPTTPHRNTARWPPSSRAARNRQTGVRFAGHDAQAGHRPGLGEERVRPGHHRPRRQCLGQARRTGSCISSPCSR